MRLSLLRPKPGNHQIYQGISQECHPNQADQNLSRGLEFWSAQIAGMSGQVTR